MSVADLPEKISNRLRDRMMPLGPLLLSLADTSARCVSLALVSVVRVLVADNPAGDDLTLSAKDLSPGSRSLQRNLRQIVRP